MKRFAALAFCLLVGATQAGAITYHVNFGMHLYLGSEERGSITGHINTDGTLGTITAANLVDWSITLDDGYNRATGTGVAGDGTNAGLSLMAISNYLLAPAARFHDLGESWSFQYSNGSFGIDGTRYAGAHVYENGQVTTDILMEEIVTHPYDLCPYNFYNTIGVYYIPGESRCGPIEVPIWFIVGVADPSTVPLPASLPMLIAAAAGLAPLTRRRNSGRTGA